MQRNIILSSFGATDQGRHIINEEVFEVRYQAYQNNNSIDKNDEEKFVDEYDSAPNCVSHLEYCKGLPAGSIRACVYDPSYAVNTVPAMDIFSPEIEREIGWNSVFVESNKFVIHPQFQNRGYRTKLSLFKFIFGLAQKAKADYIITCVREEHAEFYERLLFSRISDSKRYPHLKFDTVLLACSLRDAGLRAGKISNSCMLKRFGIV